MVKMVMQNDGWTKGLFGKVCVGMLCVLCVGVGKGFDCGNGHNVVGYIIKYIGMCCRDGWGCWLMAWWSKMKE